MNFGKEFFEQLPRDNVPVNEWMAQLYEKTAEDGTLHLFAPYYTHGEVMTCKMDWDIHQFEQVTEDIHALHHALKTIAAHYDALCAEGADPAAILQDATLLQVYSTYFAPLNTGDFDMDKVADIADRLETVRLVQDMNESIAHGVPYDEVSLENLEQFAAVKVTEEECAYVEAFHAHMNSAAARRVGDGYAPYNSYIGAQRLCRLYSMNAPKLVIDKELNDFAAQFILHRHAVSVELTALSYEEESALLWDEEEK